MTAASGMRLTMLVIVKWGVLNRYRISTKGTEHNSAFCIQDYLNVEKWAFLTYVI
jgi:hypothetical protein